MKLLYTDIENSLTEILVQEAEVFANSGARVFYIAPNSLSFEKERTVLEHLTKESSFSITVTRFAQMARYFTLNKQKAQKSLDDLSLTMLFHLVLHDLSQNELPIYHALKSDQTFIKQLVDLFKEMQSANLTIADIEMENLARKEDLITIFSALSRELLRYDFQQMSSLAVFQEAIRSGLLDQELAKTVVIIDGFTRFSAEEESLIHQLHQKSQEIVIGTYISPKAIKQNFTKGNLYEASIDFLRQLSVTYQVKSLYLSGEKTFKNSFTTISRLLESQYDYSLTELTISEDIKNDVQIWQQLNQKEEIENIARDIRQKLNEGYRYKDILVLLGDVEAYQLQVGPIFDKYDIPYYLGKAESMSHHPLVQFMDSLENCRRYNWRKEDIINLLKSGMLGDFTIRECDQFESYLNYADINGFTAFSKDFTANTFNQKNEKGYDLDKINLIRKYLFSHLNQFFKSRAQKGSNILNHFLQFLSDIDFVSSFQRLSQKQSALQQEKDEEVWKSFTSILESFYNIFKDETLTQELTLMLIKSAMQAADYRVVPATLDVVSVKSYDLVEPHSKSLVYALGLTRTHFPKTVQQTGLISDQERAKTNEKWDSHHRFDISSIENSKKNHYTALSLFNAATDKLVLSYPMVLNEVVEEASPYLKLLHSFGIPIVEKQKNTFSDLENGIGNYKSLLSQWIALNQEPLTEELDQEEKSFWLVMSRYLKKQLAAKKLTFPEQKSHLATSRLSPEVLAIKYPDHQPLSLSSSALTVYHDNQYKYFLQYVLGLQELESIHPDARHHGTYLHRVFEYVMDDQRSIPFDDKIEEAIQRTNQERLFQTYYQSDAESRFSLSLLEDIAKSTASIFPITPTKVLSQEERFQLHFDEKVRVNGIIDRIDQLDDGSIGIVDYKSSQTVFDIGKFYNGLNSQLPTYLEALNTREKSKDTPPQLFGAMYLHMQDPKMDLNEFKLFDDKVVEKLYSRLTYKGIFLEREKEHLASGAYQMKSNLYSEEELRNLLDYNQFLYLKAEKEIRAGHFLINPYTEDGKTVKGDQLKAITRFEADLDLGQARMLLKLPTKEKREGFLKLMKEDMKGGKKDEI